MPFRKWSEGDLADSDAYNGQTTYNKIEAFETNDRVNKSDLARPIRNVFENVQEVYDFAEVSSDSARMKNGVFKRSLVSGFAFSGTDDIILYTVYSGGDSKYYTRLAPGVAIVNNRMVVSRPQTHIAERQLANIFSLETFSNEAVYINYYYNTDKYQARIVKRDVNGTPQNNDFGGTWGDSTDVAAYNSAVELIEGLLANGTFGATLYAAIGDSVEVIPIEPTYETTAGDTYHWNIQSSGSILLESSVAGADEVGLVSFTVAGDGAGYGDSYTYLEDKRTYEQNYNDFGNLVFLNVPQSIGDSGTYKITNPMTDTSFTYSAVTNQNTLITFLRQTGDSNVNGVFGFYEDNIPDVTPTKTDSFYMNYDLVVRKNGSGAGDTRGAIWASLLDLSSSTWEFYGTKAFLQGNVGIGTTSATLVNGVTDTTVRLNIKDASIATTLNIEGVNSRIFLTDTSATADSRIFEIFNNSDNLYFSRINDAIDTRTTYVAIKSGGNVGIGTTDPASQLHTRGYRSDAANMNAANLTIGDTTSFAIGVGGRIAFEGKYDTAGTYAGFGSIEGGKETVTDGNYEGYLAFGTRLDSAPILERMRISSAGNVGIGTTIPSASLHVSGDATTTTHTALIIRNLASANTATAVFKVDNINAGDDQPAVQINQAGSGAILQLLDTNAPVFTVIDGGNVGIGTTIPANVLHAYHATNDTIAKFESLDDLAQIQITDENTSTYIGSKDATSFVGQTSGLNNANLNILASGYVGIGTTNPGYNLDVNGSARILTLAGGSSDTVVIHTSNVLQTRTIDSRVWGSALVDYSGTTANYIPKMSGTDTIINSVIYDASSQIGIGTTIPANLLHVYHATDDTLAYFQSADDLAQIVIRDENTLCYVGAKDDYVFIGQNSGQNIANLNIGGSGYIGIGTTNPTAKLHVVGGIMTDNTSLRTKVLSIGDWNMDLNASPASAIPHGITLANIRHMYTIIISDDSSQMVSLEYTNGGGVNANATNIILARNESGLFDNSAFDSTSFNRGYVIITYEG